MKTGLVLEGGGAKGAFHCGAIKALYDNGYTFDGAVGTSIGAINAALVVQDGGYEALMEMWTHVTPSMFTDFDDMEVEKLYNKELNRDTVAYWTKQALKIIKNLGIPTEKVLEFLKNHISEEKIRLSKMDLGLVTYSLSDREPVELFLEDIPYGKLHNYLLASAYYPAFRLKRLDGKFFIDGGVYNNMPISLLAEKGYDKVIAIRTMSKMPYITPVMPSVDVNFICPSEDLGRTMQMSARMINRNIKLGYYDALRFLKNYAGKRYYIDSTVEDLIGHFYVLLDDSGISREEAIKEIVALYPDSDIDDAIIAFLEEYAYLCGVEKFYIYNPKDFLRKLKEKAENVEIIKGRLKRIILRERAKKDKLFLNVTRS